MDINLLRTMMTNEGKTEVNKLLESFIKSAGATQAGIDKIRPSMIRIADGINPDIEKDIKNIAQQIATILKIQKQQSLVTANICLIAMTYLESSEFNAAVAKTMNKQGHGREAIKSMWDEKLKGN